MSAEGGSRGRKLNNAVESAPNGERLGILGGTFDPPHIGHCVVAQELHFQLELDRVLIVPAAAPPHKREPPVTGAPIRIAMLNAALGDDARFEVSTLEVERQGASYTVDTLRQLRSGRPDVELYLAVGADQLDEFDSWREPEEIVSLARIVSFARAGERSKRADRWARERIEVPALDISSTEIRNRVHRGAPVQFLLPEGVEKIIRRERLYR